MFSTYVGDICRVACVKLTAPLERVLRVLLTDPSAPRHGYDLMKAARLSSGTLYPVLARLYDEGLVTSAWETHAGDAGGRPPRKYYQLTGEGVRVARLELARASAAVPASRAARGGTQPAKGSAR
jgi:PadR family transcriptional regulator, regulatory protein PadR